MPGLAAGNVDLDVRDALPLRFGERLDPPVDVDEGAAIGLGQIIEGLLAYFGRHGVGAGVIGGDVPEALGHLQELGGVDASVQRRSQLGDDVLGLAEGGGIDGILDFEGYVSGRNG